MAHKYSAALKIDGVVFETKPFYAKNKSEAVLISEKKAKKNFPEAEDIDCIVVEEVDY